MGNITIPLRPKNDADFATIKKADKECLVYQVLMQVPNQTAYVRFHPELAQVTPGGKVTLGDAYVAECRNFFSYGKHKEYAEAYKATLEEFLSGRGSGKTVKAGGGDIDETRKDRALKALLDQAMGLVESGADLDPDTLKTIADVFKRLGILKEEEESIESPRRYLPERCSDCRYRKFVEEELTNGNIEEVDDE